MRFRRMGSALLLSLLMLTVPNMAVFASSHREAPGITKTPKVDGTDFYLFRSYEGGRSGYVTFLANYQPFQDLGGPNFYMFDPSAIYEIHIDKNGDAVEDMTFQFSFQNTNRDFSLAVGTTPANTKIVAIPLINKGTPIGPGRNDTENLNVIESYTLSVVRGGRRSGRKESVTTSDGAFLKPVDRIGDKSIPAYDIYANDHIYSINIPGCSAGGRVFVGQRRESFVFNADETFDLINTNPLGAPNGETNPLARKNVSTLALEVPISCVATAGQPIIGAWTTASAGKSTKSGANSSVTPGGQFSQVSRLGMALVNEVVIGLKDKDRFNASEPKSDTQFLDYVTNPTLPELIELLFPVTAPNQFPRTDLVTVFLTGIPGLNQPPNVVPSEMLRLNTDSAVVAAGGQNPLGVIGGDTSGYPNGRRPGDDVVDISLRVAMGKLLPPAVAPSGQLLFTDGAFINATVAYEPLTEMVTGDASRRLFRDAFPYLERPLSFSPAPVHP